MNGHGWKTVFALIFVAGVGAAWVATGQLASLETGQAALTRQVERMDARWITGYDRLDNRLRDIELGER